MKTIALAANYNYLTAAETAIKSILYHVRNVKIYLFNYDIPQEWFINVNQYANQIGCQIVDEKFNPELISKVHVSQGHINKLSYARYLIPQMLPEDRVLYLDSDLVVDGNIDQLFSLPFGGKKILAAKEFPDPGAFNSGVVVMDNKELKKTAHLSATLLKMGNNTDLPNGDQTVLNQYFQGQIGELPAIYNYQAGFDYDAFWNNVLNPQLILRKLDEVKDPKIIHFVSRDKPFNFISHGRMRDKWWFYHNLSWPEIVQKYTIYDARKVGQQKFAGQIFIFTRSVNIAHLEELMQGVPNACFNVAAYTNVAWRLIEDKKYFNYRLYPQVTGHRIDTLVAQADLYLDINYELKQQDIIDRVKARHVPILAFQGTASQNADDQYQIFADDQVDAMIKRIEKILSTKRSSNN